MSLKAANPGLLKYFHGVAVDQLDEEFHGDDVPLGEGYVTALKETVNTYCGFSDHAGPSAAVFVERLPYEGTFEYQDALLGALILQETRRALDGLLEADEELRQSLIGDDAPSDEIDREVRRGAREHDWEHGTGKKDVLDEHLGAVRARHDQGVRDSFYDGQDSRAIDKDVGASSRDQLDGLGKVNVFSFDGSPAAEADEPKPASAPSTPPSSVAAAVPVPASSAAAAAPSDATPTRDVPSADEPDPGPAMRLFGERPRVLRIDVPDFQGEDPIVVFRQSTKWLCDQIIAVASGSHKPGSFPRIAPIIDFPGSQHAISVRELCELAADIRAKVDRLRPPIGDGGGRLRQLLDEMLDCDPNDAEGLRDTLGQLADAFLNPEDREPDDKYGLFSDTDWRD